MIDESRPSPGGEERPTTGALPHGGHLRTDIPDADEDGSNDTLGREEPGAGVTDIHGQPLAGSAHGGAISEP